MKRNLKAAIAALALALFLHVSPGTAQEIQLTSAWNDGNVSENLAAGCTDNCTDSCTTACNTCCDRGGVIGGLELLYLKPHLGSTTPTILGTAGSTWDSHPATRVWLGYENAEGLGARFRYFQFDHQDDTPGTLLGFGAVATNLELHVVDFEGYQNTQFRHWLLQTSAGARYASRRFAYNIPAAAASASNQFEGVGPELGLMGYRPFGNRGLSYYAGARFGILFGDSKFHDNGAVFNFRTQDHTATVTELSSGLQWTNAGGNLFARAGFEAQMWQFGQPNSFESIGLGFGGFASDLGFIGPTLAVGLTR